MANGTYKLLKQDAFGNWGEVDILAENGKILSFDSHLDPILVNPSTYPFSNIQEHIVDETIHHTIEEIEIALEDIFEPIKGNDDYYVTNAEKVVIGNTSGINTGDETTDTIKSKLGITVLSGNNTGDQDLSGLQLKNHMIENTSILTEDWVVDSTYDEYGYKAVIIISGITSSMLAKVILSHTDSISGNYSPICVTGTDSVTIYSKENTEITIPTILIQK